MAVTPAANEETQNAMLDYSVLYQIQQYYIISLLKLAEENSNEFYNLVLDYLKAFYADYQYLTHNDFRQLADYIINDEETMFY